jgi:hypothetical protein
MTFSNMTHSTMKLNITNFSLATQSIMIFGFMIVFIIPFSIMTFSV